MEVEETLSPSYQFDAEGNVVEVQQPQMEVEETLSPSYQFDAEGNVVAESTTETSTLEGESGVVSAIPNFQFDENGTVVSS